MRYAGRQDFRDFALRLERARLAKEWTQSDLARRIWGEIETKNGRKAAKNRDRISTYERGTSFPDPHNLVKLARALNVDPADLAPSGSTSAVERQDPEFSMTALAGHKAHLRLNKVLPFAIAAQIAELVSKSSP